MSRRIIAAARLRKTMLIANYGMLAAFGVTAMVAGFVDTIAGGGGLITVPALLLGGIPPLQALGTNKLQGAFGVLVASISLFSKTGLDRKSACISFAMAFLGGSLGAFLIQQVGAKALDVVIPVVLSGIALYFMLAPATKDVARRPLLANAPYQMIVVPCIGLYDGMFGPGAGSFYALSCVALRGLGLVRATATAKLFNFASNLASLGVFVYGGKVIWLIGGAMIGGQVIGARLGALAVNTGGEKLIRPTIIFVSLAMLAKYVLQKAAMTY
jgi:uncharacterized protein